MSKPNNEAGNALIDVPFDVLDHGHISLVDYMGSDQCIDRAARTCTGNESLTRNPEDVRKLIRLLLREQHTSPLEMCELKFDCVMPIFVARQWVRHRTASISEQSGRYSQLKFVCYTPTELRAQSKSNKQMSTGLIEKTLSDSYIEALQLNRQDTLDNYQEMLDNDVARELARIDLPLSIYTHWFWKIDLHNVLKFLKLRLANDAQVEIQEYAKVMATIVQRMFPITWEAFTDYSLEAVTFSKQEMAIIRMICDWDGTFDLTQYGLSKREATEFLLKLEPPNRFGG